MQRVAISALLQVASTLSLYAAEANAVPICPRTHDGHYDMQLRGISFEENGELVEVFIYDNTFDPEAYGAIIIENLTTGEVEFEKTYGDFGVFNNPGTFAETVLLPYETRLGIHMSGQEFSQMSIFFGADMVAAGATFRDEYPKFSTVITILRPVPFLRGNVNSDARVDISDAVCVLLYLFGDEIDPCKEAVGRCLDAADVSDDGTIDIADAVYLLSYLFAGGPAPQAPFIQCEYETTHDELTCLSFDGCP